MILFLYKIGKFDDSLKKKKVCLFIQLILCGVYFVNIYDLLLLNKLKKINE